MPPVVAMHTTFARCALASRGQIGGHRATTTGL